MAKLAGKFYVHYKGEIYAPGDELPSVLSHLAEGHSDTPAASEGLGGTTEGDDDAFDVDEATVPELREFLDHRSPAVDYKSTDRKDALQALAREALKA